MKSSWGFSGTLLAAAYACAMQMPLAAPAIAQEGYQCDPTVVATVNDVGDNLVFRDKIMIRAVKSNDAWATACDVPLRLGEPSIGTTCDHRELLKDKKLRIDNVDGKLSVSIRGAGGEEFRAGTTRQWYRDGSPVTDGGDWLEMTAEVGANEEHYFVMMLDYNGAAIPKLAPIAKLYLVEAFAVPQGGNASCTAEMPSSGNVKLLDRAASKATKPSVRKRTAEKANGKKSLLILQTDGGVGDEPGKIKG